jgi:hypothetical protein
LKLHPEPWFLLASPEEPAKRLTKERDTSAAEKLSRLRWKLPPEKGPALKISS